MTRNNRENRARFSPGELERHQGKWVAFSADGRSIVADGESITELCDHVRAAGQDPKDVVMERIDRDDVYLGGAELL